MTDDQLGPTRCRQTCLGGAFFQSVEIWTPWITPSRCGPRKLGQSPSVSTAFQADVGLAAAPSPAAALSARKIVSAVGLQRHASAGLRLVSNPSMRTSARQP